MQSRFTRYLIRLCLAASVLCCAACNRSSPPTSVSPASPPPPPQSPSEVIVDNGPTRESDIEAIPPNPTPTVADNSISTVDQVEESVDTSPVKQPDGTTENAAVIELPDPVRVIVLAELGPIVIDFYLLLDDIPFRQSTDALIDEILRAGDSNQDGQTAWKEMLSDEQFTFGQFGNPPIESEQRRVELAKLYDINSNKYVDRNEVLGFLRQDASNKHLFYLDESQTAASPETDSPLFRWLDTDSDQLLDQQEQTTSVHRIWKNDADDDRILREADFGPNTDNSMAPRRRRGVRPPRKTLVLREYSNWSKLLYALEEKYAYGNPLTVHDIPDFAELFLLLDADQDEFLSPREFSEIQNLPPHVELVLNFGSNSDGLISIRHLDPMLPLESVLIESNRLQLAVADSLIELDAIESNGQAEIEVQINAAFNQFDADQNGAFSENEFSSLSGFTPVPFDVIDINGDEAVDRDELAAILRSRQMAQRNQISGNVGASRQPLFGQLDINGDGQLTAREVSQIPARLMLLDENGDGNIALNERPNSISIQITRGPAPNPQQVVAQQAVQPRRVEQSGPPWFRGMDLNRDGEISKREFLGPVNAFEKLDSDVDQFISLEEATANE